MHVRKHNTLNQVCLSTIAAWKYNHTCCHLIDPSGSNRRILLGEIHHAINPNPYRGISGSDPTGYARDVQDQIDCGTSGKVAGFISETIQVGELTLSIVSISSLYGCFDNLEYETVKELRSFIFLVNIGSWRSS